MRGPNGVSTKYVWSGAVVLMISNDRSTLSWTKSFSQARSKKRASKLFLRAWSILINWNSGCGCGCGQCLALTSHHITTGWMISIQAAVDTAQSFAWSFRGIVAFTGQHYYSCSYSSSSSGVNSGDIKTNIKIKPSIHHVTVPSFWSQCRNHGPIYSHAKPFHSYSLYSAPGYRTALAPDSEAASTADKHCRCMAGALFHT